MPTVTLALHAMATRFELVLHGDDAVALRAAGEEALAEIERLENRLSLFRPASEIAHINSRAAEEPVRVSPEVYGLLQRAREISQQTGGAFDITIAPLVRCWGFHSGIGRRPGAHELAEAKSKVGMHLVQFDARELTIQFAIPGMMLDLGAIGKGYAIERAVELLREAGVASAFLHGGTSTAYALGSPPDAEAWKVAVDYPDLPSDSRSSLAGEGNGRENNSSVLTIVTGQKDQPDEQGRLLATIPLKDEALSVSAVWGRCFRFEGKVLGHIIDPRSGTPADRALLAAVALRSATDSDAFSTALLTLGPEGHDRIAHLRQEMRTLVLAQSGEGFQVKTRGIITTEPPQASNHA